MSVFSKRTPVYNFKALPEHWDKALTPETGYKVRPIVYPSLFTCLYCSALFSVLGKLLQKRYPLLITNYSFKIVI